MALIVGAFLRIFVSLNPVEQRRISGQETVYLSYREYGPRPIAPTSSGIFLEAHKTKHKPTCQNMQH